MIEAKQLTKKFGSVEAVKNIDFSVASGEIVGFLGPNGAGKTTTLRILSGFMAPTSGSAKVAGFDVVHESLEARKNMGYLPENSPLYSDMRVTEYLKYRARIKRLNRSRVRHRVNEVIQQMALPTVANRVIGTLSRGFKQRVGIADALLADPKVLMLDEPTTGLDPNQIREVREMIRHLAPRHTVLISSHLLHEVEMMCNRVLILHKGQLIASDTPAGLRNLASRGARLVLEVQAPREELKSLLLSLDSKAQLEVEEFDRWLHVVFEPEQNMDLRPILFTSIRDKGWTLRELRQDYDSLEDVFVKLTQGGQLI